MTYLVIIIGRNINYNFLNLRSIKQCNCLIYMAKYPFPPRMNDVLR